MAEDVVKQCFACHAKGLCLVLSTPKQASKQGKSKKLSRPSISPQIQMCVWWHVPLNLALRRQQQVSLRPACYSLGLWANQDYIEPWSQNKTKRKQKPSMVVSVFKPSTWEYEAGVSQVHGLSNLQSEFKGSLESLVRRCLKMKS